MDGMVYLLLHILLLNRYYYIMEQHPFRHGQKVLITRRPSTWNTTHGSANPTSYRLHIPSIGVIVSHPERYFYSKLFEYSNRDNNLYYLGMGIKIGEKIYGFSGRKVNTDCLKILPNTSNKITIL